MTIRSSLAILSCLALSCTVYVNQAQPQKPNTRTTGASANQATSAKPAPNRSSAGKQPSPRPPARRLLALPDGPTVQFVAAAPTGMGLHELGRPYDATFQRLPGSAGTTLFPSAGEPIVIDEQSMEHQFEVLDTSWELAAHASAWGLRINASTSKTRSHASYQAIQISRIYEIDDATRMRSPPKDAVWYPWRIYVGRMYEIRLEGEKKAMGAGLEADLLVWSAGIEAYAQERGLTMQARGRGLVPSDSKAIFADTAEEIEQRYDQASDGGAAVVMVVWRSIPGRVQKPKPTRLGCREWAFEQLEWTIGARKSSGSGWDGDGSAPDVSVSISVDGKRVRTLPTRESTSLSIAIDPPVKVSVGSSVELRAVDVDFAEHDHIDVFDAEVPGALDAGELSFGSGAARLVGRCNKR